LSDPDLAPVNESRAALGGDFIVPALACGLAAYYFGSTVDLVWEAKATGLVVGGVLVALCAAHVVRLGVRIATGTASLGLGDLVANHRFNRQRLALIALVALFVTAIHWVGTTFGLLLLLIGAMLVTGVRSVRALLGVALTTTAVVYGLLIRLLDSRLPRGPIENLLGALWGGG
jgi:hypothetical protein